MHVSRTKRKGCQFCNNYDNLVITGPIALKFRMQVGTHQAMHFHVSVVTVGVLLHVRTCMGCSQISRTAEPIALKFGTVMETG